jgi:hypothetical protein
MNTVQITILISDFAKRVINNLKGTIAKSPTGVGFVSIRGYENRYGEVSNNLINVGASYENAKKKDIEYLENLDLTTIETKTDLVTLEKARTELINSLISPDKARSNGQKNAYTNICTGLKVHNETGDVYVWGFRVKKDVIQKGDYPTVNSRPKTIAKNELRKGMKTAKFTQYKVANIEQMNLNGDTLEF